MRFLTMWYVQPAKPQISLRIRLSDQSLCLLWEYSMTVKPLTEHHLEFLSLKGRAAQTRLSLFMAKCNIVGSLISILSSGGHFIQPS